MNDSFVQQQLNRGKFGETIVQAVAMTRCSGVSLAYAPQYLDKGHGIDLVKMFDPRFPSSTPTSYVSTNTYQVKTLYQLDAYPTAPMEIKQENPMTGDIRPGSILSSQATHLAFVIPHQEVRLADVYVAKRDVILDLIYSERPTSSSDGVYNWDNITKVSTMLNSKYLKENQDWGAGRYTNSHNALLKKEALFEASHSYKDIPY